MNRLKELRIARQLNMRQTAMMLNIPYTTYVSYEKGEREPNSETILKLADFFGCSVDYLLGRSDEFTNEVSRQRESEKNTPSSNSDILTAAERDMITRFRLIDDYGKETVNAVLDIEYKRVFETSTRTEVRKIPTRTILHSNYRVSAGFGVSLGEGDNFEEIEIPDTQKSRRADFALTIKGDSMEPIYRDGDIVLVKRQEEILLGEIGIFILDGEGYIKKFGGDRLISLNAAYRDIRFGAGNSIRCVGKVIGRV